MDLMVVRLDGLDTTLTVSARDGRLALEVQLGKELPATEVVARIWNPIVEQTLTPATMVPGDGLTVYLPAQGPTPWAVVDALDHFARLIAEQARMRRRIAEFEEEGPVTV